MPLNTLQQQYLSHMGIDIWHLRAHAVEKNILPDCHSYCLLNADNQYVGILLLDTYPSNDAYAEKIQPLLQAMLSAINLSYQAIDNFQDLLLSSRGIAIVMPLTQATTLMDLVRTTTAQAQRTLVIRKIHHPRILLEDPAKKREAWADLKQIQLLLNDFKI